MNALKLNATTAESIVVEHVQSLAKQAGHDYCARHTRSYHDEPGLYGVPLTHAGAVASLVKGLAGYVDAHQRRFESKLADDYVLGPAWLEAARAVLTLLNGELDGLDGGTIDGTLRDLATFAGFEEEL